MELQYLDDYVVNHNDITVKAGYTNYENPKFLILEVTFNKSGRSFYFFENDILDELDDDEFTQPDSTINMPAVYVAIDNAKKLNSIKVFDIVPEDLIKKDNQDWFRSYKLETSLGFITVGFGKQNGIYCALNCVYGWSSVLIANTLKILDTPNRYEIKTDLLFSLIGLDNLLTKSAPSCVYQNPLEIEYTQAS